ncbi:hypothetical protein [Psychrosphaera algicola]|uniref:TonB-dependent receptor n=1 Tax=Psychrosphaera algicola TaxID=3023714 RepID=A0ABT5FES9_9GAMM|nr:hypothetical protein [Psychrosphaera sp. G1-22]MDC2889549.1 hypothetical protein [Psychrosphaera sp. G1-22]
MKNSRLKLSALALAIASSLTATAVTAAEADEQVKADDDVEVIQIRGIRASTKKNLNQKRFAMAIVDTITPEDIGKFPDKNVADTLSRILV